MHYHVILYGVLTAPHYKQIVKQNRKGTYVVAHIKSIGSFICSNVQYAVEIENQIVQKGKKFLPESQTIPGNEI